jgi:hypothetical protein
MKLSAVGVILLLTVIFILVDRGRPANWANDRLIERTLRASMNGRVLAADPIHRRAG